MFEERQTEAPGHATELARSAKVSGCAGLIVAGGDGSISEVCAGLMAASEGAQTLPVLLVGSGTGNDFQKLLPPAAVVGEDVRYDWRDTVKRMSSGAHTTLFDVARVVASGPGMPEVNQYYVNSFSAGFASEGCRIFSRWVRKLSLGVFGYHLTGLLTLLSYWQRPTLQVAVDGVEIWSGRFTAIFVNSGRCYGGSHWVTPRADPRDGLLDLVVFKKLNPLQIALLLPRFRKEVIEEDDAIERHVGERFVITSTMPLPAEVDGQLLAKSAAFTKLSIEVLPKRFTVVT
jgi:diacylglycerol kinase family enzyme